MTNSFEARVASLGPASEPCARGICPRPRARWADLLVAVILSGSFAGPAFGNMYSCKDAAGHIILRDVPCKRGESSRDPAAAVWRPKAAPAQGRVAGNADQISESQVQALVDGMDAATARRDVNAILSYLASDAVWEVEYRLPQGLQFMRLNKEEYAARLREAVPTATAYPPERENTRILIAPGAHSAELTTTLHETIRIRGEWLSGVTRSKSMVEMRDGRPLITLVRAATTFDVPEAKDSSGKQKGRGPDSRP